MNARFLGVEIVIIAEKVAHFVKKGQNVKNDHNMGNQEYPAQVHQKLTSESAVELVAHV